jgi:RNA-binding protein YlmH
MNPSLLQHFLPEERHLVEKIDEWARRVNDRHEPKLTDFLDPRQQEIVRQVAGRHPNVKVSFHGGYPDSERKRAFLAPDYAEARPEDFALSYLSIVAQENQTGLKHADYMGSLLSLGIKREKFGDILTHEASAQVVMDERLAGYVISNLQKVKRQRVIVSSVDAGDLRPAAQRWETSFTTVSSLRLDAVLAEAHRLSRSKASDMIGAGFAKVNWKVVDSPAEEVNAGDIISLKGYGRIRLWTIEGANKKGRIKIQLGRLQD